VTAESDAAALSKVLVMDERMSRENMASLLRSRV
jgi:hypothetical protein